MNFKLVLIIVFLIGSFYGFVFVDYLSHVVFNRYIFHTMWFMYFCLGGWIAMIVGNIMRKKLGDT